jgi:hypothetical protein
VYKRQEYVFIETGLRRLKVKDLHPIQKLKFGLTRRQSNLEQR